MAPELLEVQTCMDDWSSATLRQQEIQRDENEDLFDFTTEGTETSTSCVGSD